MIRGRGHRSRVAAWGLLAVLSAAPAAGVRLEHTDQYLLSETNRLEQESWIRAGEIRLAGEAADDVALFGSTVELSGTFRGDIHAVGTGSLVFSGEAEDQVRLAGNRIRIAGRARRSLVAAGVSVSMDGDARMDETVALFGDTVITDGVQHGDLWVFANTATIQGELHGTLHIRAEDIVIQPGTRIHGDLVYASSSELVPGSRVELGGQIIRKDSGAVSLPYAVYLGVQLVLFLSAVLFAIPLLRLFPRTLGLSAGFVRETPGRCALTGLIALWVLPLFALACVLFPPTIPLGLVVLCAVLLYAFTGQIVVALVVGTLLLRKRAQPSFFRVVGTVTVGLLVLYILSSTPILNVLIWLAVLTLGLGGLLLGSLASQQTIQVTVPGGDTPEGPEPPAVPSEQQDSEPLEPKE